VKFGALAFIVFLKPQFAIQLQLLGGVWILQTLPAIVLGLYTRWPHRGALLGGWLAGMGSGTYMAWTLHFKGTVYPLHVGPLIIPGYAALWAVIVNFAVVVVATLGLDAAKVERGGDATQREDYGPA
jgi:SSS family solute:Na+ symporter